jgi:hypothetical protein
MKGKRLKKLELFYKRLFVRHREHVGIRTSYNLYRMHPVMRLISRGRFMEDENPGFTKWVQELRGRGHRKLLLLGNAPCLTELTPELFERIREAGYLTIGLNRSIYHFQTDVLVWTDLLTIHDVLRKRSVQRKDATVLHVRLEREHQVLAAKDKGFGDLHRYWSKFRNFRDWPKSKLFMFRNSAVPALHLCHRLGIREVLMVGFGFDNRDYFYQTDKYKNAAGYEIISAEKLEANCGGYDTQRIIREVLEYLVGDEGFDISYNGDSRFLATIPGVRKVDLRQWEKEKLGSRD